jgi:hypothetical protein
MDEKLTCPRTETSEKAPRDESPMAEACDECPALLREVSERGEVSYYCRVFKNRFRSPGASVPITTRPLVRRRSQR